MAAELVKVKELFLAALEMTAAERSAYLDTACAGDDGRRRQIEAMLPSHEKSGELLPEAAATEADRTAAFTPQMTGSATAVDENLNTDESLPFLAPSAKPDHLGRVGHDERKWVIGKGAFALVRRAFDERLRRAVAIKVPAPAYAAIGSARARFI